MIAEQHRAHREFVRAQHEVTHDPGTPSALPPRVVTAACAM